MPAKVKIAILKSFLLSYVKDGETVEQEIRSYGPEGTMKIHPGGSVFLGVMDLLISSTLGVTLLRGVIFRIRASDGQVVAETKNDYRADPYFDKTSGEAVQGKLCWEFIGDDTRFAIATEACKTFPALAKLVKIAREEIARRKAA